MSQAGTDRSATLLASLTDKQREALDLLLLHKTSKEIARDLGISPHTVEQRIRHAKEKLGVARRSDLATAYRNLLNVCEGPVYDNLRIDPFPNSLPEPVEPDELSRLTDSNSGQQQGVRLVPAIFDGKAGGLLRVGVVFAIAAAIMIIGIGGLAVLEQLSRLLA